MNWISVDKSKFKGVNGPWVLYKPGMTRSDLNYFETSVVPHLCDNSLGEEVLAWISNNIVVELEDADITNGSLMNIESQTTTTIVQKSPSQTEDIKAFQRLIKELKSKDCLLLKGGVVELLKIAIQTEAPKASDKSYISICLSSLINKNADPSADVIVEIIKRLTSNSTSLVKIKLWRDVINKLAKDDPEAITTLVQVVTTDIQGLNLLV
jgi:hypothetical protein